MKIIKATFAITTPMFLGDANQKSSSIRPPSIKGALRFWWRALAWKSTFANANNDAAQALRNLHNEEARIFGSAVEDQKGGQGIFLLSILMKNIITSDNESIFKSGSCQYLLGQGLWDRKDRLKEREYIKQGTFTLKVLFKPLGKKEDVAQRENDQRSITNAILLWGLLGGLGSRARKGFGSVAIQSIEGVDLQIPQNIDELKSTLVKLIGESMAQEPPFTAFSGAMRIDISKTGNNALALLDSIGQEMQMYRSFGRDGKVSGKPAEKNFQDDHDVTQRAAGGESVQTHPRRVAFGLPHNYFFSSTKNKLDVEPAKNGRRSSPLFIHIHQFPSDECCAIQTFLPAMFLPENDQIAMKGRGRPQLITPDIDWNVITDYLNRFAKNSDYQQVIP